MTQANGSGRPSLAARLDEAMAASDLQAVAVLEQELVVDVATRTVRAAFAVADELSSLQSSFRGAESRIYLKGVDRPLQIQVIPDTSRVGAHRLMAVGAFGDGDLPVVSTLFRGSLDATTGVIGVLGTDEISLDDLEEVSAALSLVDLPMDRDPARYGKTRAVLTDVPTPMWRSTHDRILEAAARIAFRQVASAIQAVEAAGAPMSIRLDGVEAETGMDEASPSIVFPDRSGRSDEWRFEVDDEGSEGRGIVLAVGDRRLTYDVLRDEIGGMAFFRETAGSIEVRLFRDIHRDMGVVRRVVERRMGRSFGY